MGDYNAYDRVVVRCEVVSDDASVMVEESIIEPMMEYSSMAMDDGDSDLEYFDDSTFYGDDDVLFNGNVL